MAASWAQSALSWWEEAGVDTIVGEEPRDWLNPKATAPAPAAAPPETPAETLPADLDAYHAWLRATNGRALIPAGDPAAGLMMMTDMPSGEDAAAGMLFAGETGVLFDRMMTAIGHSRETIYLAAFSPVRPAAGRIDDAGVARLAEIARHHIGLAAPRALLLFGDSCSRALLGMPMTAARGRWHALETSAGPVKTLVTIRPQDLLTQPKWKAHAWADLQLLMEELKP
jgi:DNA polymerase